MDPAMHEFDRVAGEVLKLFPVVVMIVATVGAQMCFTVILSKIELPEGSTGNPAFTRRMVAASWLLFLVVTFCAFAAGAIDIVHGPSVRSGKLRKAWFVKYMAILVLFGIEIITFAAFGCMATAVREFDYDLGQWAIGIVCLGALITVLSTAVYAWRVTRNKSELRKRFIDRG
ncbi:hypothetical protein N656DRAFT_801909 [Canariomyces notabilis]|uniref:Uncharacterized protein n=1 Tax=Canariomyces notabilis TaxID=2074819 RepID=A0AAN6QDL7_9PEZI|nr:hypothetical protein N656DRAFT_801909 [Canariomyces arenarius]